MSSVNISINGKQFRVACEPGQEHRVTALAEDFDQRISSMRSRFGEVGDARLTVMAAMMIGDELLDANAKIAKLEAEIGALNAAHAGESDRASRTEAAIITALDAAADRIERMAHALSRPAGGGMAVG
ncbi:cell division protein ZapA [Bradyrhizobium sp. LHD-71]|uniref:cell division protein ZapA n=1 Tax=Bradyrhizobium sp. LHD-71 TaxID=3072141 RepID=UPI00280E3CA1|nr:cell division protein ZapA [Bradyrhizobium sp. LHD-71]MDQ8726738.1 cell division protein ZapA [Bradyrhizobium sp. LHD-71]